MIESGVTFDLGQLVMDDEIARMIKFTVAGIAVTDESMAVSDIARVGAFGDFLSLDATLKHMRELSQSTLLDRRVREDWQARGATDLATRARTRALELVESHQPLPLDADVADQLRRIIEAADRERGVA
jgi:trimethylamine--corrinoid protein Co-methyltransferase